jgi:hypothetical protein
MVGFQFLCLICVYLTEILLAWAGAMENEFMRISVSAQLYYYYGIGLFFLPIFPDDL